MRADYYPARYCEWNDFDDPEARESCFFWEGNDSFEGAWFQPAERSYYEYNFRFVGGMTAWVECDGLETKTVVMSGATALTTGAIAFLTAAIY